MFRTRLTDHQETTMNITEAANREAVRRAPVDDIVPSNDAQCHYRIGFRDAAEWLAADCIIIPRTDLPPMNDERAEALFEATSANFDPEVVYAAALRLIAAVEWREKHPPVDEAQVDALAAILGDFAVADEHDGTRNDRQLARLLVQRGVTVKED